MRSDLDILASSRRFAFSISSCLEALVYARSVNPCSKKRTVDRVLPSLYGSYDFSYDEVLSCLHFIGSHYQKIVELFTVRTNETYILDTSKTYFDCTNLYFETDAEDYFRRKGSSKENRKDLIVGMGLLLDANLIPIDMRLYPGNQSEKPLLRNMIAEMKQDATISSRTVQVADKGLNCAKNIHAALQDSDGYIFSKSVKMLPDTEKKWVLLDEGYECIYDDKDRLKFKLKSAVDTFSYEYEDDETGRKVKFQVREKRIVSFNPKLAKKQRKEIEKMVEKAKSCCLSQAKRNEYGESSKFVDFLSQDKNGEITGEKALAQVNQQKVDEALSLCGFHMLVTSELKMKPIEVYDTYHELWRIEESFRCIKTEIEARPVYLQNIEKIKGHFLICYLAVLLERIFQFKVLNNSFGSEQIYDMFKDFNVVKNKSGNYTNTSVRMPLLEYLSSHYSLPVLHLYMNTAQIQKMLERQF